MIVDFQFPSPNKNISGATTKNISKQKKHISVLCFPVACIIENDISLLLLVWMVGNQTRNQHCQQKLMEYLPRLLHAMEYLPPIWVIFNVGKFRCISLWSPGPFFRGYSFVFRGLQQPRKQTFRIQKLMLWMVYYGLYL